MKAHLNSLDLKKMFQRTKNQRQMGSLVNFKCKNRILTRTRNFLKTFK